MKKPSDFERFSSAETEPQTRAIYRVAADVHRLNESVQRAVNEGVSIELVRVSRFHSGVGAWGDQIVPTVRQSPSADAVGAEAPDSTEEVV